MNSNHCIFYHGDELLQFTDDLIDNRTMLVIPFHSPPHSTLKEAFEENAYELCGPLLMLLIEFSRSQKTLIKLKGKSNSISDMVDIGLAERIDILLTPASIAQFIKYSSGLEVLGILIEHSDFVGYNEIDVIAARKYPGTVPIFGYLLCFPMEVWALVFISVVILSIISSINQNLMINIKESMNYFYNYSVLLLSKSMERRVLGSTSRQILIVWLLSALVLSNQFTAYLMDSMVRTVPELRINTFQELSARPGLRIVASYDSAFVDLINMADTPLKRALQKRLLTYEIRQDIIYDLAKGLRNGSLANINSKLNQMFLLADLAELDIIKVNEESLVDLVHLSEKTGIFQPYMFFFNKESPDWLTSNINKMVNSLIENGLIERWMKDVLSYNRRRIGNFDFINREIDVKFASLYLHDTFDIFYLWIMGILISVITFIVEFYIKPIVNRNFNEPRRFHNHTFYRDYYKNEYFDTFSNSYSKSY